MSDATCDLCLGRGEVLYRAGPQQQWFACPKCNTPDRPPSRTELPWRVVYAPNGTVECIRGSAEDDVPGACPVVVRKNGISMPACEIGKANAELIVRAVNCHDELLAACEGLAALAFAIGSQAADEREVCAAFTACRAAIDKAKGK